jgi:hypothetical protein
MRFLDNPTQNQQPVQRQAFSIGNDITPFGCCNFFDACTTDILSLYYRNGLGLLDWMGFEVSDECFKSVEFIECVRPEQTEGADTIGYIANPCAEPNGIQLTSCQLTVEDFGLYGRQSPARNLFKPEKYCVTRPRYTFDGQPITSESDWDMTFVTDVMLNDIRVDLITGNANVAGQFDGLQRWVSTNHNCQGLYSYVVNWNNNGMGGGAGITLNGAATAPIYNIVDWLLDLHRNIMQRIGWSPMLNNQNMMTGDMILLLPSFMARCLLDYFACWSVCPGAQYEEVQKNLKEINEFRQTLNGGMFGDGQISLDGHTIPLLAYDWGLINGPTRGDMYLLTGSVGAQRIWQGEHLDANVVLDQLIESDGGGFFTLNDGRVLGKEVTDELCRVLKQWMSLRLWCLAPYLQVRFQDVACHTPSGPLSPNPADSSFYITTSCEASECP